MSLLGVLAETAGLSQDDEPEIDLAGSRAGNDRLRRELITRPKAL